MTVKKTSGNHIVSSYVEESRNLEFWYFRLLSLPIGRSGGTGGKLNTTVMMMMEMLKMKKNETLMQTIANRTKDVIVVDTVD